MLRGEESECSVSEDWELAENFTFDDMGKLISKELRRRLGNREKAAELPGTLLMRLFESYTKAIEKRNEIEKAKLEQEKLDPLEIVNQEGLPDETKLEILLEYVDELEDQWRRASEIIVELQGGEENGEDDQT